MTRLLQEAFEKVSQLDVAEQNSIAQWLLDEIAADRRWNETFERSQDALAGLAAEALEEHRAGRTKKLDPDSL